MPTIQQPGKPPVKFIHLETRQANCRCCGRGQNTVCESCNSLLKNGYAFFIEVEDTSTEVQKKPTGYAIAFEAKKAYFPEDPTKPIDAALYFIRETELKQFLGNGYSKKPGLANGKSKPKFINKSPRWRGNNSHSRPTDSTRSPTELAH